MVTRGADFVFAQELDDVARFLDLPLRGARLEPHVLGERIMRLLETDIEMAGRLPPAALATRIKGRDRSYADIAYHVGQIVYLVKMRRGSSWSFLSIEIMYAPWLCVLARSPPPKE